MQQAVLTARFPVQVLARGKRKGGPEGPPFAMRL